MTAPMPCKAFFFDLDGTILDSETVWTEAMLEAMTRKHITVTYDEIVDFGYGRPWSEIYRVLEQRWPGHYTSTEDMCNDFRPYYDKVCTTRDISFPGSLSMIRLLKTAGYYVAIVTGSYRERALEVNDRYQLNLDGFIGLEDYTHGKPNPEPYLMAARLGGFQPQECIVVEDAAVGIESGHAAGMKVIAVNRLNRLEEVAQADMILNDLGDFTLDMLERNPSSCIRQS